MEAKVTPTARAGGSGAQRFAAMTESEPFARLRQRIEKELDRERKNCEYEAALLPLGRAQGAAAALRMVLGLPKIIMDELRLKGGGGE